MIFVVGSALLKVSQTQFKLGNGERDFINNCCANSLLPIRRFLEGDMKTIQVPVVVVGHSLIASSLSSANEKY